MIKYADEDSIERSVEKKIDRVDRLYLDGQLSEQEYDLEIERINAWADAQYKLLEE